MVQRKAGRKSPWMVQVRDNSGNLVTRSFMRKEDAVEFELAETRKRQLERAGLQAPIDSVLLVDFSKIWMRNRAKSLPASTTNQDASRLKNYWLGKIGLLPLASITSAKILEILDDIQFERGQSPASRNRHRALLHTLFQDALRAKKVGFNPVASIPLVEEKPVRKSGTLEPRDQDAYVAAMYRRGSRYGIMVDLMLWTGARIMTAAAVQNGDIDFEVGVVRLNRLVERATGEVVSRTKGSGEGGAELVPLFPRLRDRLLAHLSASPFKRPTDFVAAAPDGSYVAYEAFRDAHHAVLNELKLPRFTPHAIRKAFATNAKRGGYTRAEIREMLGHSTEAMTAKYDLEDIEHLISKGERLGFGKSVSRVSTKRGAHHRILKGGKR